ncbi:hypothetical protein [Flavobacterium sp.]|uniref:hypothetical protein n=1 Tax=Flavobacterium sp. TaxID=239 RepID=UPI0037C16043
MHSYVLKIPSGHLKKRIEDNYILERDLAYKNFVLCLLLTSASLQLNVSQMHIEDARYDHIFKDNIYNTTDLRTLLIRIGVPELDILYANMEFITDFLSRYFNPRLKNFFSVGYDSGYTLIISLKQTK